MKKDSAFALLLRRQSTSRQREQLYQARANMHLSENDALWGLVQVVEDFCSSLGGKAPADRAPMSLPPDPRPPRWMLFACGLAVQAALMALSFAAGTRAIGENPPNWLADCAPRVGWPFRLLAMPAGWMIFVFVLPILAHGVRVGWQLRRDEPGIGWTIAVSSALAACSSASALWWLL